MLPDGTLRPGDCGDPVMAVLFFDSFYFFGAYLAMNLFVAVIVDTFSDCMKANAAEVTAKTFESFGSIWNMHTKKSEPPHKYLALHQLDGFLQDLGEPLGVPSASDVSQGATSRVRMIREECKRKNISFLSTRSNRTVPAIGYRKLLGTLCLHAVTSDYMPYAER